MALYVVKENQELLWNIINNNTFVQQYFAKVGVDKKPQWFRDIISKFYQQNNGQKMSIDDLHSINKSTIAYMINDIREHEAKAIPGYVEPDSYRFQSNGIYTPPVVPDNRKDMYASQFDQRQKEYQQMTEKKAPKEVDFRENVEKDTAITNMDDLMKQQLLQRERELDIYKPTDNIVSGSQTPSIKIDNSANIQIEIDEVDDVEDVEMTVTKKAVSWKDTHHMDELNKKYNEAIQQIESQSSIITDVREQLRKTEEDNVSTSKKITILTERIENMTKEVEQNKKWKEIYDDLNDRHEALQMHTNLLTKKIENMSSNMEQNHSKQAMNEIITQLETSRD